MGGQDGFVLVQGRPKGETDGAQGGVGVHYGLGIMDPDVGPHKVQVYLGISLERHRWKFGTEK